MFKLAIDVFFKNYFGSIHFIVLPLESTKSVYFCLGHRVVQKRINLPCPLRSRKQESFPKIASYRCCEPGTGMQRYKSYFEWLENLLADR